MSIIEVPADSDFSIRNLPYGIFSTPDNPQRRPGVAIGRKILDLHAIRQLFDGPLMHAHQHVFESSTLNAFMRLDKHCWHEVRRTLTNLLKMEEATVEPEDPVDVRLRADPALMRAAFADQSTATLHLPVEIGDYTDFYSSREHAVNVGTLFRGRDNALQPNWTWLPVGYHGRASSIVVSGTPVRRPLGQVCPAAPVEAAPTPRLSPSQLLDFELELGFFIGGPGNPLGQPIDVAHADDAIFGVVLLNDWSARDIQKWEYVPLGPFLGKNFATSISPWVVSMEALLPFKTRTNYEPLDHEPLAYLRHDDVYRFDVDLAVAIRPADHGDDNAEADAVTSPPSARVVARSNTKYLYWTMKQQLAHHSIGGCNIRCGDLYGSGTISGTEPGSYGSMLELTWRGANPVEVGGRISEGKRKFLADGDEVIMTGGKTTPDGHRVGFGECRGMILPALPLPGTDNKQ